MLLNFLVNFFYENCNLIAKNTSGCLCVSSSALLLIYFVASQLLWRYARCTAKDSKQRLLLLNFSKLLVCTVLIYELFAYGVYCLFVLVLMKNRNWCVLVWIHSASLCHIMLSNFCELGIMRLNRKLILLLPSFPANQNNWTVRSVWCLRTFNVVCCFCLCSPVCLTVICQICVVWNCTIV